jgi:hypothetical protein
MSTEVSIVVPNFNKADRLETSLLSALSQGDGIEVIVVDDASTDSSVAIVERLQESHKDLRLLALDTNVGGSRCRNLGLSESKGRFVIFMDSDDVLLPGCCDGRILAASSFPDNDAWIFPMSVVRSDPHRVVDVWRPSGDEHLGRFLSHRIPWQTMQPMWRTDFVRCIGGFDPDFKRLQDVEFHTRALLAGARIACTSGWAPDSEYFVEPSRHGPEMVHVRRRHVDAALQFYATFFPRVPSDMQAHLAGTLLEASCFVDACRRRGELDDAEARDMQSRLVTCCRVSWQRRVLRMSARTRVAAPVHVPGIRMLTHAVLTGRSSRVLARVLAPIAQRGAGR